MSEPQPSVPRASGVTRMRFIPSPSTSCMPGWAISAERFELEPWKTICMPCGPFALRDVDPVRLVAAEEVELLLEAELRVVVGAAAPGHALVAHALARRQRVARRVDALVEAGLQLRRARAPAPQVAHAHLVAELRDVALRRAPRPAGPRRTSRSSCRSRPSWPCPRTSRGGPSAGRRRSSPGPTRRSRRRPGCASASPVGQRHRPADRVRLGVAALEVRDPVPAHARHAELAPLAAAGLAGRRRCRSRPPARSSPARTARAGGRARAGACRLIRSVSRIRSAVASWPSG